MVFKPKQPTAPATAQVAKGNVTPQQAAKAMHTAPAVLGELDSTHHTC